MKRLLNDKDAEIKTKYDDFSVDELKEALKNIFFYAGEFSDADMKEMDQIMAALDRKEPITPLYTAEESWKKFKETYGEELSSLGVRDTEEVIQENPPANVDKVQTASDAKTPHPVRGHKLLRVAVVAAAVMVLLFAIAATASAMGYNIFGWVPKWNESTFKFVPEDSTHATSLDIPTALKQIGVEEPMFPTWLPEEFELAEQKISFGEPILLCAVYFNKDRTLTIIIRSGSEESLLLLEKDNNDLLEYTVGDTKHFIFTNSGQTVSSWYSHGFDISVYGDVTQSEMISIINSIY